MTRSRSVLGLHTPEERERAFGMAEAVFKDAQRLMRERGDLEIYQFASGYLTAVEELANAEGENELARRVGALRDTLVRRSLEMSS